MQRGTASSARYTWLWILLTHLLQLRDSTALRADVTLFSFAWSCNSSRLVFGVGVIAFDSLDTNRPKRAIEGF